jgi:hypothetical protein
MILPRQHSACQAMLFGLASDWAEARAQPSAAIEEYPREGNRLRKAEPHSSRASQPEPRASS